jgi:hypothetical protein
MEGASPLEHKAAVYGASPGSLLYDPEIARQASRVIRFPRRQATVTLLDTILSAVGDARASSDHGLPGAEARYSTAVRIRSGKLRAPSFTFS